MTGEQLLLACVGLGVATGLGLLLMVVALRNRRDETDPTELPTSGGRASAFLERWAVWRRPGGSRRLAVAATVAVLVGAGTGWPVGGVLAAVLAWWLPRLIGPDREYAAKVARIEAIATWTESLRDTLSAAAGLEQTMVATARRAPAAIRDEIGRLVTRLDRGVRLPDALTAFADDLDDPTGDLVVAALVMAAERNARELADLLGLLATTARDQASLRLRVAAGRARVQTSVRVIVVVTLSMAVGLAVLNAGYLAPYDGPLGQLMLLAVGGLFAASFAWLRRMAVIAEAPRVLTGLAALTGHGAKVGRR